MTQATAPGVFPVVSSTLANDALVQNVLTHYALPEPRTCYLLKHGINDTHLVYAGDKQYILRIYTAGEHSSSQIEAEMAVLDAMQRHGIVSSVPISRRDGQILTEVHAPEGIRYAVLFSFVEGQTSYTLTTEQCSFAGSTLARFHQIFDGTGEPLDRPRHSAASLLDAPLATIESFAPFAAYSMAYLREVVGQLKQELARLHTTAPEYGLCHGDFFSGNLLIRDSGLGVIDLDFCAYCWRVYDLATFIWLQTLDDPNPRSAFQLERDALLEGYQSVRALSDDELRALPCFVLVRHIWLLGGSGIPRTSRHGIGWLLGDYFERYIRFIHSWFDNI